MVKSNSNACIEGSAPRAALLYPATHVLLELSPRQQASPPQATSLNAAMWHARQVVSHAMNVGDQATAAQMTEAFAQIALHSFATPRPNMTPSARMREHATLRDAAMSMVTTAYPVDHHGFNAADMADLDALITGLERSNQ